VFHGPGPGRPKGSGNRATEELKKMIRERTVDGSIIVETLMGWLQHSSDAALVIGSAKILLEYGYGKPKESIEVTGEVKMSLAQLFERMAEKQKLQRIA
jgi:hypothetical protein